MCERSKLTALTFSIIMKPKDMFLAIVEAALWFGFIYYFLYAVKNEVNIAQTALILLALAYLASWACPLIRHSSSWRRTFGKTANAAQP